MKVSMLLVNVVDESHGDVDRGGTMSIVGYLQLV